MIRLLALTFVCCAAFMARGDPIAPSATLAGVHGGTVGVAFSPDGKRLAVVTTEGDLQLWDLETQKEVGSTPMAADAPNQVYFTPDGATVVALGVADILLMDGVTGKAKPPLKIAALPGGPMALDVSPDGKSVAVVGRQALRIYDLSSGQAAFDYEVHSNYSVKAVAFSPDGSHVATASTDHTALYVEIKSGKIEWTMPLALNGESVLFAGKGKLLVYSSDGALTSFDLTSGAATPVGKNLPVIKTMARWTDSKSTLIAGGARGPRLVSLDDGKVSGEFDSPDMVPCAAVSADGKWVAGGGLSGGVFLWKVGK